MPARTGRRKLATLAADYARALDEWAATRARLEATKLGPDSTYAEEKARDAEWDRLGAPLAEAERRFEAALRSYTGVGGESGCAVLLGGRLLVAGPAEVAECPFSVAREHVVVLDGPASSG